MHEETKQKVIDVDMRGQVCPATLLVAMDEMNKHMQDLQKGDVTLCIKTDNRDATNTIPTIAQNMGYSVKVTKEEAYYQICVEHLPSETIK